MSSVNRKPFQFLLATFCVCLLAVSALTADAQEIGNDFRISFVGGSGDPNTAAHEAAVACQSDGSECLVAWRETVGDQIAFQRVNPGTAAHLGTPATISSMTIWATNPQVAYDPGSDRYLVVWRGYNDMGASQYEIEIFGQLIDADTGAEVGPDDFRISHFGTAGDTAFQVSSPTLTNNSVQGEFLVAWKQEGGGTTRDIALQLIDASTGLEIGTDFTVTDAAGPVSSDYGADRPAVAHDVVNDEYLVVWMARIDSSQTGFEIFGQRLNGATVAEIGADDLRISFTGVDGVDVDQHQADYPAVAHAAATDRWIVVWVGKDDPDPQMAVAESELYLQAVTGGTDTLVGTQIRLTDVGDLGVLAYHVNYPKVACGLDLECLVAWNGDDNAGGLVDEENEIFVQAVNTATLSEVGDNDVRVSTMGGTGNPDYDAYNAAVSSVPTLSGYLVAWTGDTIVPLFLGDEEFEAWGQRYSGGLIFSDTFKSGYTNEWTSANP